MTHRQKEEVSLVHNCNDASSETQAHTTTPLSLCAGSRQRLESGITAQLCMQSEAEERRPSHTSSCIVLQSIITCRDVSIFHLILKL